MDESLYDKNRRLERRWLISVFMILGGMLAVCVVFQETGASLWSLLSAVVWVAIGSILFIWTYGFPEEGEKPNG